MTQCSHQSGYWRGCNIEHALATSAGFSTRLKRSSNVRPALAEVPSHLLRIDWASAGDLHAVQAHIKWFETFAKERSAKWKLQGDQTLGWEHSHPFPWPQDHKMTQNQSLLLRSLWSIHKNVKIKSIVPPKISHSPVQIWNRRTKDRPESQVYLDLVSMWYSKNTRTKSSMGLEDSCCGSFPHQIQVQSFVANDHTAAARRL